MNRHDRRVLVAALIVALLALILFWLAGEDVPANEIAADSSQVYSNTAAYYRQNGKSHGGYYAVPERRKERFFFDPNTADSTQLLRLGLQPWQVRNIYRYRARGGIYRRKEDFARLYGLTVKEYRELEPYIRISADYQPASSLVKQNHTVATDSSSGRDTLRYPVKLKEGEQIVLNTADTATLRKVPGIGSYYAREIVRYGKWLGGYVSINQLDEIEGFPAEAKKYFTVIGASPQKLALNRLTLQQLRRHPYINYYQAKAITDYRRLHGNLKSLDDLRLLNEFPPEAIQRLRPYVAF